MSPSGTSPGLAASPPSGPSRSSSCEPWSASPPEDADDAACAAVLAARRSEVMTALGERVVDVPADAETLIEQARREGWSDLGLAAATFGRAAWWGPEPHSVGRSAGASRRGPGRLRPRRSMAGDGDVGRQRAHARRPLPCGRPDCMRLPDPDLAPRPGRSCRRHAPRWHRRHRPEGCSSSCRLPGSGSILASCRRCPGRPAGVRYRDTRAPGPGARCCCEQRAGLTAAACHVRYSVPGGVGERRRARRVSEARTANQDNSQSLTGRRERRRPAETLVKSPAPVSFQVGNADPIPAAASKKNRKLANPSPPPQSTLRWREVGSAGTVRMAYPDSRGASGELSADPHRAIEPLLQRSLRCPGSDLPTPRRGQTTTVISVKASGLPESAGLWGAKSVSLRLVPLPGGRDPHAEQDVFQTPCRVRETSRHGCLAWAT